LCAAKRGEKTDSQKRAFIFLMFLFCLRVLFIVLVYNL